MTADIWASEKKDEEWGEAQHLDAPFNPGKAMYFSFSEDGTLYTTDAENRGGILTSKIIDGKYTDFKKLGAPFNTGSEAHPCVAHDERYLIFDGVGDAGRGLYVSFKNKEGAWGAPVSMKEYTGEGGVAMISPDGKYLLYTDKGDIYWVSTKIIEKLKSKYIHHESEAN
jgi:6-phosphogluconolactonase (cycloisomerase 2 family)